MKRFVIITVASMLSLLSLSCQQEDPSDSDEVLILCATVDADEITVNSATLRGTVLITNASSEQAETWFMIGTEAASVSKNGIKISAGTVSSNGGTVSALVMDLQPETTYYYMVYASIDGKQASGEISSFSTLARSKEVIITAEATDVTMNSALLFGYVSTEYLLMGGESGFIVSTSSTPSLDNGQKVVSAEVDKNGKYFVQITGLTSSMKYYYKAFLNMGAINLVGEIRSFITKDFEFAAVEMGLSVKWANANLGATTPEGYGDYYAWGETETKENYSWETYKWCNGTPYTLTKYNDYSYYGVVDNKNMLEAADDVAHVKLGGNWRMPTYGEIEELKSTKQNASYQWEWKSLNGHNGWLVTYLVNNNTIFLPAAGYYRIGSNLYDVGSEGFYWSSSSSSSDGAPYLYFSYGSVDLRFTDRSDGLSVRPVLE